MPSDDEGDGGDGGGGRAANTDGVVKQFLVKYGKCTTCDSKVSAASVITCRECNETFHAVCPQSTKETKICNETLLKTFSQNSTKSNFMWLCDYCFILNEQSKKCTLEDKLNSILVQFEVLTSSVNSMKAEVSNNTKAIGSWSNNQTPPAPESSLSNNELLPNSSRESAWHTPFDKTKLSSANNENSQVSRRTKKLEKKANTTILLKCNNEGESPNVGEIKQIAVSYGIPVNRVNVTANNNAVISLPSVEARDRLKPLLSAKPSLQKHAVSDVQEKQPTVTVLDISEEICEEEFMGMLKVQNPWVEALLDAGEKISDVTVTTKTVNSNVYSNVHATVTTKLRQEIDKRGNRLYLGLNSCRVEDKFNLRRCYKCNDHGHIAKNCESDACCGYCASDSHESKNCPLKDNLYRNRNKLNCINCKRRNLEFRGHSAFWPSCPVNKYFIEKAKKSLPYYKNNLN